MTQIHDLIDDLAVDDGGQRIFSQSFLDVAIGLCHDERYLRVVSADHNRRGQFLG